MNCRRGRNECAGCGKLRQPAQPQRADCPRIPLASGHLFRPPIAASVAIDTGGREIADPVQAALGCRGDLAAMDIDDGSPRVSGTELSRCVTSPKSSVSPPAGRDRRSRRRCQIVQSGLSHPARAADAPIHSATMNRAKTSSRYIQGKNNRCFASHRAYAVPDCCKPVSAERNQTSQVELFARDGINGVFRLARRGAPMARKTAFVLPVAIWVSI